MYRILAAAALLAAPATAAEPITGSWVTEEGDAVVNIERCGDSLCGRIAKFLETPPNGPDQRDVNNPDPELRSRRIMGLPILTGFTEDGDVWRGEIYDPKRGKTYRSVLEREGPNELEVKGCVGPFCQTQNWPRAK